MLLARRDEPVQRQRIFAHVRVDQERDFGVEFPECGVRRERDSYYVPDSPHVHQHLARSFFREPSAQLPNHRTTVLSLYLRLSTWVRVDVRIAVLALVHVMQS